MSLIQKLIERLRPLKPNARIALAAECAERIYPIYEHCWVGTYSELVRRSIEISWAHACGEKVDQAELEACLIEVRDLVAFYLEDESIEVLSSTVTVVLRALEAITNNEEDSSLAVSRALLSTLSAAQSAEVMTHRKIGGEGQIEVAMQEEKKWQEMAFRLLENKKDFMICRDMFKSLGDKPSKWLTDWEKSTRKSR